jgi:hypothetical protein
MELNFILPVLIFTGLFILLHFLAKKNILNNRFFVWMRIVLAGIYVGYLISEISRGASTRSVIIMILLSGIILFGAYSLQKKYFILKDPDK